MTTTFILLLLQILPLSSFAILNGISFDCIEWSSVHSFPINKTIDLVPMSQTGNITNKIVYIREGGYFTADQLVKEVNDLAKRGSYGAIWLSSSTRPPGFIKYSASVGPRFEVPVGLTTSSFRRYVLTTKSLNFTFYGWDPNPWDPVFTGPGFKVIQALMIIMFTFNVLLASYQLTLWIKYNAPLTIGLLCLITELIVNILRVIQVIINPLYNIYNLKLVDILTTITICLALISSILVVFFWLDLTSDPFYHGKFLGIMRKPALGFIGFSICFELICDFVRISLSFPYIVIFISAFYLLAHGVVSIFYFVAAARILKSHLEERIQRVSYRIIGSGICTFFSWVFLILFWTPVATNPIPYAVMWFLLLVTFFLQSYMLIIVFKIPRATNPPTTDSVISNPETNT